MVTVVATLLLLNLTLGDKQIDTRPVHVLAATDPRFPQVMGAVLGRAPVGGNRVEALQNGDQIFPAMLAAIGAARQTITLETYIYWSGATARAFTEALLASARRGVQVHLLLDWIGGELDEALLERMRRDGIEVRWYNPPHWSGLGRLNNRTHRRILVVDGRVGFTGGAGIADKWQGDAQDAEHWRDSHFRIEGPVVVQLQSAFIDNWLQSTGDLLQGPGYLPEAVVRGDALAQVFDSSPGGGAKSMQLMFLMAITAATRSIDLAASYFVPDEVATGALVAALRRGVRLRILLPGPHIDYQVVRRASRHGWGPLLDAGAEIHEYQPTMFHRKVMVVDERLVSFGSTNFDNRSFSINDEVNMNVFDEALAHRQTAVFEQDLRQSRRMTASGWHQRPWHERLLDTASALLSSQL